jgi:hypothetical protein
MMSLYIRFLIVAIGSSALTWLAIKYLIVKYRLDIAGGAIDLVACVVAASSTCGFIGIVLVDRTQYAESALFYWMVPIAIGFVFGVITCRQITEDALDRFQGTKSRKLVCVQKTLSFA